MGIDIFTLRLSFILLPGLIVYGIVATLGRERVRAPWIIAVQVLAYGLLCYLFIEFFRYLCPAWASKIGISGAPIIFRPDFFDKDKPTEIREIIYACVLSLPIGLLATLNVNRSLVVRFAKLIRLTKRHGHTDVWAYLHNSLNKDLWVAVRFKDKNTLYYGYVEAYSGANSEREILLSKVRVLDNTTGALVQELEHAYLAFKKEDVTLEINPLPEPDNGSPSANKEQSNG